MKPIITARLLAVIAIVLSTVAAAAQNITLRAVNRPAAEVFSEVARQCDKNFIYSSDLLKSMRLTVDFRNTPLKSALGQMFRDTPVDYKIKGRNIMLTRRKLRPMPVSAIKSAPNDPLKTDTDTLSVGLLREVTVVGSPNQTLTMNSPHIGALNLSRNTIARTPVLLGESDVIKTLQLEPGITPGVEGMAGMYVHGGGHDENLYMLDNIPLYQVNHAFGLFSAFNTEAIRNVDFYKSTFPAKFDGRLSSFMDVYTREGKPDGCHGSVRLGLTSGAFNIEGPVWRDRTTFSVALRRSWFDLLTIPAFAIYNSLSGPDAEKTSMGYAFTDLNAKITHRFTDRSRLYAMVYYGEDYLRSSSTTTGFDNTYYDKDTDKLRWGNIVASTGWIYDFSPRLWVRLSAAFTRYGSSLDYKEESGGDNEATSVSKSRTRNNIADWIGRADFDWRTSRANTFNFGAAYTFHTYTPDRNTRSLTADGQTLVTDFLCPVYHAGEWNFYAEDNLRIGSALRLSAGLHYSLFHISGKTKDALSPRASFNLSLGDFAIKGGYSRTAQYVHQLQQSTISLPTDQWVPVVGDQKPQTADKVSLGVYWKPRNLLTVAVEGFWKKMHHLLDYREDYYLLPPEMQWDAKLCEGSGSARGVDFKIAKEFGRLTGQISYSLLWADRRFPDRNFGRTYPARNDNRHKINIVASYKFNDRWEMSASWIGMSGNRMTLPLQNWSDPYLGPWHYDMNLRTNPNNYRLPFYHRLDLSFTRHTSRGYWNFSLYNAYCNLNTIGVRVDYSGKPRYDASGKEVYGPVFQKVRLIPVIPSVSYTWLF